MVTKHRLTSWLYIQLTIVHRIAVYPTFFEEKLFFVKHLTLRVKHLTLRVKHLTLRVKHLTLRVKQ